MVIYLEDQIYVHDSVLWCRECFLVESAGHCLLLRRLPVWGLLFHVDDRFLLLESTYMMLCNYTIQRRTQKLKKTQR